MVGRSRLQKRENAYYGHVSTGGVLLSTVVLDCFIQPLPRRLKHRHVSTVMVGAQRRLACFIQPLPGVSVTRRVITAWVHGEQGGGIVRAIVRA